MNRTSERALGVVRPVIQCLVALDIVYAVGIAAFFVASVVMPGRTARARARGIARRCRGNREGGVGNGAITEFSLAPWLAALLLFVLSGVFAHGARMRADLEGTV